MQTDVVLAIGIETDQTHIHKRSLVQAPHALQ